MSDNEVKEVVSTFISN